MTVGRLLAVILLSLLLLVGCTDDDVVNPSLIPPDGETSIDIPTAVGMLWKYQVYDSLTETTDTIWWSITDLQAIDAGTIRVERKAHRIPGDFYAWQFLHLTGDTLEIFDDTARENELVLGNWRAARIDRR